MTETSGRSTCPARLDARLDNPSRWLWLVKWVLVIPHAIVLVFLWLAVSVVTVVAGIAILSPGLFDFLMGMNRWCYRVTVYVALTCATRPFRFEPGGADPGTPPANGARDGPHRARRLRGTSDEQSRTGSNR